MVFSVTHTTITHKSSVQLNRGIYERKQHSFIQFSEEIF